MNANTILDLLKARLGISGTIRDAYLLAIINGVIKELEDEKGIALEPDNNNQIMFIVDFTSWRYQSKDNEKGMPRHLQFRLHNLMIHNGGDTSV